MDILSNIRLTYFVIGAALVGVFVYGKSKGADRLVVLACALVALNAAFNGEPLRMILAFVQGVSISTGGA